MKRTILTLLVAGLFAGIGTSAMAQDAAAQPAANEQAASPATDSNSQQPAKSTGQPAAKSAEQPNPAKDDVAAKAAAKADYDAAKITAQAQYKEAKAKCDTLKGDSKSSCMTEAKTAQTEALARAKTQWETQGKMNKTEGNADPSGKDDAANSGTKPATDEVSDASDQSQYPKQ